MLMNLSPKTNSLSQAQKHCRHMNKFWREPGEEKMKPLKFHEIFAPTEYTGVYWCSHGPIDSWCKQHQVYGSPGFWKHLTSIPRDNLPEYIAYENNAWTYGVADNLEQVVNFYNKNEDGYFKGNHVIFCGKVVKNPDEPCSGWRWHKWGPYIGTQNPKCEYINDEPEITEVIVFSIYKII